MGAPSDSHALRPADSQDAAALEGVHATFATHALTQCLPPQALGDWYTWATRQVHAFQRASSAVEGRNGYLAQMHHNQRGLPKQRYKVWAVLHNFDGRASDAQLLDALFQAVISGPL